MILLGEEGFSGGSGELCQPIRIHQNPAKHPGNNHGSLIPLGKGGKTEISIEDVSIIPPEDLYFKKIFHKGKVRFNYQESYHQDPLSLDLSRYGSLPSLPLPRDYRDMSVTEPGSGQNRNPSGAGNSAGETALAWESVEGAESRIFCSTLLPGGRQNAFFRVSESTGQPQTNPDVILGNDGTLAVVWEERQEDGTGDVYIRFFTFSGTPLTAPIIVNETVPGDQGAPAAAFTSQDEVTVVWQDDRDNNGLYNIYRKVFTTRGQIVHTEEKVNQKSQGQQTRPVIASNSKTHIIAWQSDINKDRRYTVHARSYGEDPFDEKDLSQERLHNLANPSLALSEEGTFALAWENRNSGKSHIEVYLFDPSGRRKGELIPGNQIYPSQIPAIAFNREGMVFLSWQEDKTHWARSEIFYNVFDSEGKKIREGIGNSDSTGFQMLPGIAVSRESFRIFWQDDRDRNGDYQILMRSIIY